MRAVILCLLFFVSACAQDNFSPDTPVSAEIVKLDTEAANLPTDSKTESIDLNVDTANVSAPQPDSDDTTSPVEMNFLLPFGPLGQRRVPSPQLPPFLFGLGGQDNLKPIHSMSFEMDLPPVKFPINSFPRAESPMNPGLFGGLMSLQSLAPFSQNRPMFFPHHQPLFHPFHMFSLPPRPVHFPFSPIAEMPPQPINMPFHPSFHPDSGLLTSLLNQILDQPSQQEPQQDEKQVPEKEADKEPMILNLTTRDNFYVITGCFPGLTQENVHIKLEGSNFVITGKLVDKTPETIQALGDLSEIDEVDETMELPYAPDSHLFKVHFDNSTHVLTAVFPKQQTTELSFS